MTIDEAIRKQQLYLVWNPNLTDIRLQQAMRLGIEALKRCKVLAENSPLWATKPLPGETEE